jgi:hypothetical protein
MLADTTGPQVVGGGVAALAFAAVGFVWVQFGLSAMSRRLRFPAWYDRRYGKLWNYGWLAVISVAGAIAVVVGVVAWVTGTTFH